MTVSEFDKLANVLRIARYVTFSPAAKCESPTWQEVLHRIKDAFGMISSRYRLRTGNDVTLEQGF